MKLFLTLEQQMSKQQIPGSQEDFQDFTSLPDTQDANDLASGLGGLGDEVEDSGMEAGIESESDDDNDDSNDMIVLDPEHVRISFSQYHYFL